MSSVQEYFDLRATEVAYGNAGTVAVRQLSLYGGVMAGALSKVVYDAISANSTPSWPGFVVAAVASIVVFPTVYRRARLNSGNLTPLKYFVAFQYGFFWSIVMDGIARLM